MTQLSFLDIQALTDALGPYADRVTVRLYDTLDSTNTEAKRAAPHEAGVTLYIARTQTAGRGRLGRSFHSPADTGLYMTLAYTTDRPLTEVVGVTAAAAVAGATAIEALTDKRPGIKWVNDLYLEGGKLAGILCETVSAGADCTRVLVGVGINLTTSAFPDGLRAPAVSLFSPAEARRATPGLAGALAGTIARRLLALLEAEPTAVLTDYRARLLFVGETVLCTRGEEQWTGRLCGVDEEFSLLVETDGKVTALSSGEISVRIAGGEG